MRYAIQSDLEIFIKYSAEYMDIYPLWWEHSVSEMVSYIMRRSGGMNPRNLEDKVSELYKSVGM